MTQLERNKEAATSFYDLMFNQCKPAEAIEAYAGDEYIQHNPEVYVSTTNRTNSDQKVVPGRRTIYH